MNRMWDRIGNIALAAIVATTVGCGGGDGGADAMVADAPITRGTIAFSWAIEDPDGNPLACEDIGAGSVSITATPTAGGFGQVDPFSCDAGSGMSRALDPANYDVSFRLSGTAGALGMESLAQAVEVVAGEQVDTGSVTFVVEPAGGFSFKIAAEDANANCDDQGSGGAGITALEIRLLDDEGVCLPTTFAVDDPDDPSAPDYVSDCAGATYGCVDSDVTFSVAETVSGPHSLVIDGARGALPCYSRTSQLVIPGGGLTLSLPDQVLALAFTPECDPNAPDAGVGGDAQ